MKIMDVTLNKTLGEPVISSKKNFKPILARESSHQILTRFPLIIQYFSSLTMDHAK